MKPPKTLKASGPGYELYSDGTAALLVPTKTGVRRITLTGEDLPALYQIFGHLTFSANLSY